MKRLCTICARGGSKGVPNKNIRELAGMPLIAHSISHAKECGLFDAIAVSSDSDAILDIAKEHKTDFQIKSPDHLASDTAGKIPAIRHCQTSVEEITGETFETYVDLDATAPLRLPDDITKAVAILENRKCSNVISGCKARRSPYFNLVEARPDGTVALSKSDGTNYARRQDTPDCFDMNASIYVWKSDVFSNHPAIFYEDTRLLVMPELRSVDIDNEIEFQFVELIMEKGAYLEGESHDS